MDTHFSLDRALSATGELLARRGQTAAIVVVGGTALNLLGVIERFTSDVGRHSHRCGPQGQATQEHWAARPAAGTASRGCSNGGGAIWASPVRLAEHQRRRPVEDRTTARLCREDRVAAARRSLGGTRRALGSHQSQAVRGGGRYRHNESSLQRPHGFGSQRRGTRRRAPMGAASGPIACHGHRVGTSHRSCPSNRSLRRSRSYARWQLKRRGSNGGAIFSFPGNRRPAHAIVDPEALLLVSLVLGEHVSQGSWSRPDVGAFLKVPPLSVQRVKNLLPLFPSRVPSLLGEFARQAIGDGGDLRWRSVAGRATKSAARHRDRQGTPVLEGGPPLMLRLRLGMGVGIKPDVVAYLIAMAGGRAPVQLIARSTAYHGRAVRRALEELAAAGFVEPRPTAPISYRADALTWAKLLAFDPNEPPPWRSWATVYAFVAALDDWSRALPAESDFVLASEAREIMFKHGEALDGAVRLPRMDHYRGEAFLEPFVQL